MKKNKYFIGLMMTLAGGLMIAFSRMEVSADSATYQASVNLAAVYLALGIVFLISGVMVLALSFYKPR